MPDATLGAEVAGLLREVRALGRVIAHARREIAAIGAAELAASQIPAATDELDAVVAHTAAATHGILEACELLDSQAVALPAVAAQCVTHATTRIYEACSFQDITGQRIRKVVATLRTVEAKVAQIVAVFDAGAPRAAAPAARDALLSGPQMPGAAMGQTDVDRLMEQPA